MTKRLVTTLAGAAACLAVLPATAPAAPKFKSAAFEVTLAGEEVSTWEHHKDTLKDDPCGSKIDAFGDQTVSFGTFYRGRLLVARGGGVKPILVITAEDQRGAMTLHARGDRNGARSVALGPPNRDCGDNGGGVEPRVVEKPCGDRYGLVRPQIEPAGRTSARLTGFNYSWGAQAFDPHNPPLTGLMLDDVYEDCPYWEGGPDRTEGEGTDSILPVTEKLPIRAMLNDTKRKRFQIHFGRAKDFRADGFSGRVVIATKMTLIRTSLTPAR